MSDDFPGLTFVQPTVDVSGVNFMLWGPNKSGKTAAGGTLPGPILWLNGQGPNALGYARKVAAERGNVIREVHMPNGRDEGPVTPVLTAFVDALIAKARGLGFATDQLIWVSQDPAGNTP